MPLSGWWMVAVAMVFAPMAVRAESQASPQDKDAARVSDEAPVALEPVGLQPEDARLADQGLLGVNLSRLVLVSLGGAVGGTVLGLTGFMVVHSSCGADMICSVLSMLTGLSGATLGLVVGSLLVGHWMDGDGAWWSALAGVVVGVVAGVVVSSFASGVLGLGAVVTLVGAPMLGGLVYELTSHDSAKQFRALRKGLAVTPTVFPGSRGTMGMGVALSGTWN